MAEHSKAEGAKMEHAKTKSGVERGPAPTDSKTERAKMESGGTCLSQSRSGPLKSPPQPGAARALARQGHASHLWVMLIAVLVLAMVMLLESLPGLSSPAEWTSEGVDPPLTGGLQNNTEASLTTVPAFSLPGGYYGHDIQVHIRVPHPDAKVFFTVDGSVPTATLGTAYRHPIYLSTDTPAVTVIRARALLPDSQWGPVASASYFMGVRATLPLLSLIAAPEDLWDLDYGIYANPHERGAIWERPVDVTYVGKDRRVGFQIPAGIRIHGHGSRDFDKKSLRLYFRQEYGASRLGYPLFEGSSVQSFKRLVLYAGGQDSPTPPWWKWTLIRNTLAARLAFEVNGYAAHSQPALLFINGEPWGIYQIRERTDDHFLEDHYGITSADFLEAPEVPGQSDVIMGDRENWDHLLHFVDTHSLVDPGNYAYVESQVDVANFIDYNILQIYAANDDWPDHNVHQFRPYVQGGRWAWLFWDSDRSFGAGYFVSNVVDYLLTHRDPYTQGRDTLLLRKLLENPVFLRRFLSRAADLLNTTLAPDAVIAHIDALASELAPDITYETLRWPGAINWDANVGELRDFAQRRPDYVRRHMLQSFNRTGTVRLGGTAALSLMSPSEGLGTVAVNGLLIQPLPWEGVYFQSVPVQVMAAPAPGYRFVGWEPAMLPQTPVLTLSLSSHFTLTLRPKFAPLPADEPRPGDVTLAQSACPSGSPAPADCLMLRVQRPGGVDLRHWRITDNDTKTATDEGSLIFTDASPLAHVPYGTTIWVVVLPSRVSAPPKDNLSLWDRHMVFHTSVDIYPSDYLDTKTDPGFKLVRTGTVRIRSGTVRSSEALVLLAPGPTQAFGDDRGIAFVAAGPAVTPASFGVLSDGIWP